MKNLIFSLFAIVMIVGFSPNVMAQATATASATATATIIAPITILKTADMNFGDIVRGSGTVVIAPAGTRTLNGDVTSPTTTGTLSAAAFTVGGEGAYTYAITLPSTDHTITNTTGAGAETMIVNSFTSTPTTTGALVAGTQSLTVGATLNVAVDQVSGVYVSGTGFEVTVNYN